MILQKSLMMCWFGQETYILLLFFNNVENSCLLNIFVQAVFFQESLMKKSSKEQYLFEKHF